MVLPSSTDSSHAGLPIAASRSLERVEAWEKWPWLRAAFSTRMGGVSQVYGPDEQNLSWTSDDDSDLVAENRQHFVSAAAGRGGVPLHGLSLATVRQVHGATVHEVSDGQSVTVESKAPLHGDGLVTRQPGLVLGVLTADCVPILMADTRTRAVAALHAGWRGTLAGIVSEGLGMMSARFGSRSQDLVAAIGPAIRSCCFEVGDEVRTAFEEEFPYASELFSSRHQPSHGRSHLDLQEANRRQLLNLGFAAEQIATVEECTACSRLGDRRKYFSYRAEGGRTGRMLSVIANVDASSS